jgi:signal peptidase II
MKKRILLSLLIAATTVLLDQITKYLARTYIQPFETITLLPVLDLVNVRNQGAAFGMFSSFGNAFFVTISIAAIIFMAWVIVKDKEDYRIFGLLAGGAAGNLIDRITLGYVVDFIYFGAGGYHWPAFNIADSALSIGMIFMAVSLLRGRH